MTARFHCRYCEGRFNGLSTYDDHFIAYLPSGKPYTGKDRNRWGVLRATTEHFSPACIGERDGYPVIDPAVERVADAARSRLGASRGARTAQA